MTVALVGSPNSGKTTLFNWLTGSKARTVNYAGSTVDCLKGESLEVFGPPLAILDTPGIYSLRPHGRDEEVTLQALSNQDDVEAVIIVVDGTQLNRQLYLIRQIQEMGIPFVVALTMSDLVRKSGREIDVEKLSRLVDAPVVPVEGRLGGGVKELMTVARTLVESAGQTKRMTSADLNWDEARIEREIHVSEDWTRQVLKKTPELESLQRLRRFDRIFLHPVLGVITFLLIMGALFSSIFWVASPAMDFVDQLFGDLAAQVSQLLGPGLAGDFLANGVVAGVGSVLVFVPQIFILFFGFNLLEDSGYLARAATIVDRPLHRIGLSGRAFVPILSGFACAVPAVMATRNIRSWRERWITVFILPFLTCSARLPVYALLLTFLFTGAEAWKAGLAMTGLYVGGLLLATMAAAILNLIVKKTEASHFLMELPFYRRPNLRFTFRIALRRTYSYVRKAGPTIFTFVLILWVASHLPYKPDASSSEQVSSSYLGQVGQALEPAFEPMGMDWRGGVGMLSAFVAREVFVSSMAVIFNLAETDDEDGLRDSLLTKMRDAKFADGREVFTPASVAALVVFFMIALQCLSTTGVTWREMGSWKYAAGQLVALNLLAYVAAVGVFQLLSS